MSKEHLLRDLRARARDIHVNMKDGSGPLRSGRMFGRPHFPSAEEEDRVLTGLDDMDSPLFLYQFDLVVPVPGVSGRHAYVFVEEESAGEWSEIDSRIVVGEQPFDPSWQAGRALADYHDGEELRCTLMKDCGRTPANHEDLRARYPDLSYTEFADVLEKLCEEFPYHNLEGGLYNGQLGGYPFYNGGPAELPHLHKVKGLDCPDMDREAGYLCLAMLPYAPDEIDCLIVAACRTCGMMGVEGSFT